MPNNENPAAPRIVVVGSINMDLVARMVQLPRPGETVSGDSFQTIPGGKGANQAVAARRLGANVFMVGRLGEDSFGTILREHLIADGIETSHVFSTPSCSSGVALIGVESSGANCITVIPGANGQLTVQDVEASLGLITHAKAIIVQLESPTPAIAAAIQFAQQNGVLTVLDPAPAPPGRLPQELMRVDVLSPNQTEAEALTGIVVHDWETAAQAASDLQQHGAKDVVLKLGSLGAFVATRDGHTVRVNAIPTNIVDTTAAGDAFTAALTVALCEGRSLPEAAKFGCLAGTLACTRFGAQPAMPTRDELEKWSNSRLV
ncbi:ribokinase [Schlesneria paludicola]|uniref:ribokinase n=1 Tax=Schlesneria paludicola TaxID=360056 RepID=UPI000299F85F|nr:ribokinase [Schlesneria paludicola]